MKKLAFFSILLISIGFVGSINARTCGPNSITYVGTQEPSDDEFLYENINEFNKSKEGYLNTSKYSSGDGKAWECDGDFCDSGKKIDMKAGHVFNGNIVKVKTTYECNAMGSIGNDFWNPVSEDVCNYRDDTIKVGEAYTKKFTIVDCSGIDITDQNGQDFQLLCRAGPHLVCKAMTCKNGLVANDAGKCIADKTQDQKDCESVKGNIWNDAKKECKCPDNKKWDKVKKQCLTDKVIIIPEDKKEKSIQCDDATMKFLLETKLAYPTETDIQDMVKKIIDYCTTDENRLQVSFDTSIIELKILIEKYENAKIQKSKEITDSANNIKLLYGNISGLKNEASVWKDKEGDFNKSRLISDSVAGVVLGTAGGLITSSVIKKNQTENGFEDISCTVGGQVVAGWNDEFTVGIR